MADLKDDLEFLTTLILYRESVEDFTSSESFASLNTNAVRIIMFYLKLDSMCGENQFRKKTVEALTNLTRDILENKKKTF